MRLRFHILAVFLGSTLATSALAACPTTLDFRIRPLGKTEPVHLCEHYAGKVVLVVNTASKCGYTPQFDGLEALYARFRERGLVVIGFPSNDFGGQEPGSEKEIQQFCRLTYKVDFPMFEKTHAAEATADPIYRRLGELAGEYPKWNFHKYLLDRQGSVVASYPSQVKPDDPRLLGAIEAALSR